MKAKILRNKFTVNTSCGIFLLDGNFQCYTLEDVARALGIKIDNETCIPEGLDYKIRLTPSQRWKKLMPIIYTNDDFSVRDAKGMRWDAVRMHGGNKKDDTRACPLLGAVQKTDWIQDASAFDKVLQILLDTIGTDGEMELAIENKYGIY